MLQRLDGVQLVCDFDDAVDGRPQILQLGHSLLRVARRVVEHEERYDLGRPATHRVVETNAVLAARTSSKRDATLCLIQCVVLPVDKHNAWWVGM